MSTGFKPLEIPPGVVFKPTGNMRSSNWSRVNLMRWVEGQMSPVGGQEQQSYSFASRCRAIHGWYDLAGDYYVAYLCETNIYIDDGSGVLDDITPVGGMASPAPAGSGGYSDDVYSAGTYGTPRTTSTVLNFDFVPTAWSLDNFGQVLYAMTSADGRLLQWDPSLPSGPGLPAGPATEVTSADTGTGHAPHGRGFVVTNERFIWIYGMEQDGTVDGGSWRRLGWCDQENPNAWDFSNVTSQAGFLDIEPASPIITAVATRTGILFWTGKKAYISQFLGIPYVYNYVELAANCTPWSPKSVVTTSSMAVWVSQQGAYSFDGTSIVPVQCMVRAFIDDVVDLLNVREQACAAHVAAFNEVWWFFPVRGSTTNTNCVIYNYKDGTWSMGWMPRSAGMISSYTSPTIMADGLVAYKHETGSVYPANVPLPWAETFDLNLNSGSRLTTVKQMIPDIETIDYLDPATAIGNLRYSLFYRNSRSLGAPELQTTPQPVRPDGYVDFRTTGRDIRLRIELQGPGVFPVTVGQHLVDSVPRGDR